MPTHSPARPPVRFDPDRAPQRSATLLRSSESWLNPNKLTRDKTNPSVPYLEWARPGSPRVAFGGAQVERDKFNSSKEFAPYHESLR